MIRFVMGYRRKRLGQWMDRMLVARYILESEPCDSLDYQSRYLVEHRMTYDLGFPCVSRHGVRYVKGGRGV